MLTTKHISDHDKTSYYPRVTVLLLATKHLVARGKPSCYSRQTILLLTAKHFGCHDKIPYLIYNRSTKLKASRLRIAERCLPSGGEMGTIWRICKGGMKPFCERIPSCLRGVYIAKLHIVACFEKYTTFAAK